MYKFLMAAALAAAVPGLAMANGYENADFVSAYIQDSDGVTPIGAGGRFSITPMGKIVVDATYFSEEESIFGVTLTSSGTSLRGGYRHTFGEFGFLDGGIWSLGGGITYVSVTAETEGLPEVTADDTEFYIEGDLEYPVGPSGVAHGVAIYQGSDLKLGGGYTHYVNSQIGLRGEFILDGPIEIGGVFRF